MASRVVSSSMSAAGSSVLKAWLSGVAIRVGKWNLWPLANCRYSRCSTVPSARVTFSCLAVRLMNERVRRTRWSLIRRFQSSGSSDLRNAVRVLIFPSTFPASAGSLRRASVGTMPRSSSSSMYNPIWLATSVKARLYGVAVSSRAFEPLARMYWWMAS